MSGSSLTAVCGVTPLTIRKRVTLAADDLVVAPILAMGTDMGAGVLGEAKTAEDIFTQRGVNGWLVCAVLADEGSCSKLFKRLNIFRSEELTMAMGED